ncbi:MAG TPA: DNA replication and repair protein RecF, partial [Cyclobacteriaceae bacterium]|nr:DNA replication and repair protein RecF [Cyclobacteriaceae bacterium]
MRLEKLTILNFKNYRKAEVSFHGQVQCLLGKNGSGKTNLLEAIHYLSSTRGKFHTHDESNIRHGELQFSLSGVFEKNGKQTEVTCSYTVENGKSIAINGKPYGRFSEHLGKFPVVMVAPNDVELIWEGGEVRRKYFDGLLSQVDKQYLEQLIVYQNHLKQRNGLLKMFAERGAVDQDLLDSYDEKIIAGGEIIFRMRTTFLDEFLPLLANRYRFLAGGRTENATITFRSELSETDFAEYFKKNFSKDLALGRTCAGIHRDDFLFGIGEKDLKRFGSQGQQKSFLIALKLAEFDFLLEKKGERPIVLLDDIFDKLDDERIHQLLRLVQEGGFGQIFIT